MPSLLIPWIVHSVGYKFYKQTLIDTFPEMYSELVMHSGLHSTNHVTYDDNWLHQN